MIEPIVLQIARQRAAELVLSARPDSPVRPDAVPDRRAHPGDAPRRHLSSGLRRLAGHLEPATEGRGVATAGCR